jgi:uncharacterized coiled-coil protein SlyX
LTTITHLPSPDIVTDQKAEIQRMQKLLDEAVKKKEDYQKNLIQLIRQLNYGH